MRGRLGIGKVLVEGREGGATVVGELGAEDDVDDDEVAGEVGLKRELTGQDAAVSDEGSAGCEEGGERGGCGPEEVCKVACEPADEEGQRKTCWTRRGSARRVPCKRRKGAYLPRFCSSSSRRSTGAARGQRTLEEGVENAESAKEGGSGDKRTWGDWAPSQVTTERTPSASLKDWRSMRLS